jgi:hypothetical protein
MDHLNGSSASGSSSALFTPDSNIGSLISVSPSADSFVKTTANLPHSSSSVNMFPGDSPFGPDLPAKSGPISSTSVSSFAQTSLLNSSSNTPPSRPEYLIKDPSTFASTIGNTIPASFYNSSSSAPTIAITPSLSSGSTIGSTVSAYRSDSFSPALTPVITNPLLFTSASSSSFNSSLSNQNPMFPLFNTFYISPLSGLSNFSLFGSTIGSTVLAYSSNISPSAPVTAGTNSQFPGSGTGSTNAAHPFNSHFPSHISPVLKSFTSNIGSKHSAGQENLLLQLLCSLPIRTYFTPLVGYRQLKPHRVWQLHLVL